MAATQGFKSQGYAGIGFAKEAGVASNTFYAHLGSKEGKSRHLKDVGRLNCYAEGRYTDDC